MPGVREVRRSTTIPGRRYICTNDPIICSGWLKCPAIVEGGPDRGRCPPFPDLQVHQRPRRKQIDRHPNTDPLIHLRRHTDIRQENLARDLSRSHH